MNIPLMLISGAELLLICRMAWSNAQLFGRNRTYLAALDRHARLLAIVRTMADEHGLIIRSELDAVIEEVLTDG